MKPGRKPGKTAKRLNRDKTSQDLLRACKTIGEKGVLDLKSYLFQGANINDKDASGKTPLMWLAEQGNVDMMELFLLNGSNIKALTNKFIYSDTTTRRKRYREVDKQVYKASPFTHTYFSRHHHPIVQHLR
jgi:hypothetical protein